MFLLSNRLLRIARTPPPQTSAMRKARKKAMKNINAARKRAGL